MAGAPIGSGLSATLEPELDRRCALSYQDQSEAPAETEEVAGAELGIMLRSSLEA